VSLTRVQNGNQQAASHFNQYIDWLAGGLDYASMVLADSPAGYWRLGETSGTAAADASGHGSTGTYTGGVTLGQAGAISGDADKSALFDGTSGYVSIADAAVLRTPTNNQWSIEAWVYPTSGSGLKEIIRKANDGSGYFLRINNGTLESLLNFTGGYVQRSGGTVGTGGWHHVVVTYDGTTRKHYVDGQLAASWSDGATLSFSTQALAIGADPSIPASEFFAGYIDEVAVYPTALSATRITAHYRKGLLGVGDGTRTDTPLQLLYNGSSPAVKLKALTNGKVLRLRNATADLLTMDGSGVVLGSAATLQPGGRVRAAAVGASGAPLTTLVLWRNPTTTGDIARTGYATWPPTPVQTTLSMVPATAIFALVSMSVDYWAGYLPEGRAWSWRTGNPQIFYSYFNDPNYAPYSISPPLLLPCQNQKVLCDGGFNGISGRATFRLWVWGWIDVS
jgi:hypothetical protein